MRAMPFNGTLIFLVLLLSSFYNYPVSGHQNIPRKEKETDTLNWLSFNEGHSKAIKEDKILLINVSTDWCYPCKMMKKNTFSHRGVIDTINKYFVCVYLNPEIENTYLLNGKMLTPQQLIQYLYVDEVVAYPTSIFWFHPESEEKHSIHSGYMEPVKYLKLLSAAQGIRSFSSLGININMD